MNPEKQRANKIMNDIRQVLIDDWDPIGIKGAGPHDEYDHYIVDFYRLLLKKPAEDELIELLYSLGFEQIGPSPEDKKKLRFVARKLLEINVCLNE